jgi:hypothetical protein
MTTFWQENYKKVANKYICESCDYVSSNKYNYEKHLLTAKHKNTTKYNKIQQNCPKFFPKTNEYICSCGKSYPYRASLHNHKKKCFLDGVKNKDKNITNDMEDGFTNSTKEMQKNILKDQEKDGQKDKSRDISKDLILKLVEDNSDIKSLLFKQFETMQNQINELIPRVGNNNIINKHKLNINIFLNEQCKDALTLEQFINKIEVTLGNLLVTKNKGLTEGVSDIFIENMNKLSLYERPLHCTDVKRETMYIKSEGAQWEKDNENKKLKQALKKVTYVQQQNLAKWVAEHPNWESNSHEQEEYMILVRNCTDELADQKENKVIKKLCNQMHVNIGEN